MESKISKMSLIEDRLSRVESVLSREQARSERKPTDIFLGPERATSNPWVDTALRELTQIDTSRFVEQTRETLKPTVKVLLDSKTGLDAQRVGQGTGRERNTESYYLNRLCRMGLVEKIKKRRKVLYKIPKKEVERVLKIYPEFRNQ